MDAVKQNEMRKIALGAVRSQARAQGQNPADLTAKDALAVLDDLYRQDKTLVASQWYGAATSYQLDQFDRDWSSWRRHATG